MIYLISLVELASILKTLVIRKQGQIKNPLIIAQKGYKVEYHALQNYLQQRELKENKVIQTIVTFIPGLNLIEALLKNHYEQGKIMQDPLIKINLVPMTEEEKITFKTTKGLWRQRHLMTYENTSEEPVRESVPLKEPLVSFPPQKYPKSRSRKLIKNV